MNAAALRTFKDDHAGSPGAAAAAITGLLSRSCRSGLAMGAIAAVLLSAWVLFVLGGLEYYTTPVNVRAYAAGHRLLRPAGPVGQILGMAGAAMMLMPFIYAARKRFRFMRHLGQPQLWLEVHLFCGVVGPILITLHTAFKFNGLVSAAYWSMVVVMLSGFAGRFLYVRIPRSLRGIELTWVQLDARVEELRDALSAAVRAEPLQRALRAFHLAAQPSSPGLVDLFFGELAIGGRARELDRHLAAAGLPDDLRVETLRLAVDRAVLARRAAYLQKTRTLFQLWHVFHMPLVWLMLLIVAAHISLAVYLGYVPFHW